MPHHSVFAASCVCVALVFSGCGAGSDQDQIRDMTTDFVNNPEVSAKILETVPLKRFGEAADIAAATAFLCSEEAGYVTGQVFAVDGGMAM